MSNHKFLQVDHTTNDIVARLSFHNLTTIVAMLITILGVAYYWRYQLELTQQRLDQAEMKISRLESAYFQVKGVSTKMTPTATPSGTLTPTRRALPTYTIAPTREAGE